VFDITCKQCGAKNKKGSKFCSECGEKIGGGIIKCGGCGAEIDSGSKFCGKCGKPVSEGESPTMVKNRWARKEDDFTTKVEVTDLKGLFTKGLTVEHGTKAMLFINGALADTLMPGKYDMGGISDKLKNFDLTRAATAVLVDAGDVRLDFKVTEIRTKDPVKIDVSCNFVAQLSDPNLFFVNMMKGRQNYSISDLKSFLFDEVRNALREAISRKAAMELSTDLGLKKEFEVQVETHLKTTYQRNGLSFIQFQTVDYIFPHIDKIKNIQEDVFLQITEEQAKLDGRKRLFEVITEKELQEIAEESKKVEHFEMRSEVWARMRKAVNSDKMNEVKNEDELEVFLLESDKGKLLRQEEMEELKQTFAEKKEDHEIARQHLLQKIGIEHELELERVRLLGAEELDRDLLEMKLKKKRMELEYAIAAREAENLSQREEVLKNAIAENDIKLKTTKNEAEITSIEREQDRLDAEQGMVMLEKMKAIKLKDERERMLLEQDRKEKELELRLKEKEVDHKMELERLAQLSEMSTEALIAVSPAEQASMLAELKKTETLKDMSDDQILAMAAEKSPEVAKAFQEKFKAASSDQMKELYERMLKDKDKSSEDLKNTVMEMFKTSMDGMKAQQAQYPPNVVYPPPGQPGVVVPGYGPGYPAGQPAGEQSQQKVVICSQCRSEVSVGEKYCNNCGNKIF